MSDLGTEIFKRYGATAIAFALVFGIAIWALAHLVAAPGSEVSVLWGVVKYTKKLDVTEAATSANKPSAVHQGVVPQSVKATWPAIDLYVRSDVRQANLEQALNSIRLAKNLRQLTAAESGRRTPEIASGTYFYLFGPSLRWTPSPSDSSLLDFLEIISVSRYRTTKNFVEIHYPRGERPNLILFVDESTAQQIAKLSGTARHEIMAALSPWGSATTLVSVPAERIVRSRTREVEIQKEDVRLVLDILLQ